MIKAAICDGCATEKGDRGRERERERALARERERERESTGLENVARQAFYFLASAQWKDSSSSSSSSCMSPRLSAAIQKVGGVLRKKGLDHGNRWLNYDGSCGGERALAAVCVLTGLCPGVTQALQVFSLFLALLSESVCCCLSRVMYSSSSSSS